MVLSVEGSPAFFGGGYQMILGMLQPLDRIIEAFKNGGGAAQDDALAAAGPAAVDRASVAGYLPS